MTVCQNLDGEMQDIKILLTNEMSTCGTEMSSLESRLVRHRHFLFIPGSLLLELEMHVKPNSRKRKFN